MQIYNQAPLAYTDAKMGDIPGVILVLGENVTGGTTIYHGKSVSIKILHKNGLMHAARYGAISHEASDWKGLRRIISYWVTNASAKYYLGRLGSKNC